MTAPPAEQDLMEITSTTFGIDEIDPKGDIVVKVGDSTEGRFMRVSIKTLSLASEVFNTMLGPKWIEGQTTHSAENPLALPEDDPQAMEILFKLAHLKIHNPDEIPTDCLPGLLVVCDKYGCFNTFQYWLSHTKERWFSGNGKPETTQELLQGICIAHIFDDSDKFSHFVGRLYKQASGNDIRAFMESSLCTIMSMKFQDRLIAGLTAAMDGAKQSLLDRLRAIVRSYASQESPCSHTVVRLGHCYRALWQVEQEGYADVKPDINVAIFRQKLAALITKLKRDDEKVPRCRKMANCRRCRGLSVAGRLDRVLHLDVLSYYYSLQRFKEGNHDFFLWHTDDEIHYVVSGRGE